MSSSNTLGARTNTIGPAVYDTFVQDERAHDDVVPLGTGFEGIQRVHAFYQAIAAALPDLHIEVKSGYDVPGCSLREVASAGRINNEFGGMKLLGKKISFERAAFYSFDELSGKLTSERIY